MLGELAGKNQPHRRLDFARGDRRLLVVASEPRRLAGELLEDVVDEAVHDSHGLAGNPNVGVDLLQDLEDVYLVGLDVALRPLLLLVDRAAFLRELLLRLRLLLCRCFLRRLLLRRFLLRCLWCHFSNSREREKKKRGNFKNSNVCLFVALCSVGFGSFVYIEGNGES